MNEMKSFKQIQEEINPETTDLILLKNGNDTIAIAVPRGKRLAPNSVLAWWQDENQNETYHLGWLLGEKEPYPGPGNTDLTSSTPDYVAWGNKGSKVPKIELSDGRIVWGPEVWWQHL